MDCIQRSAGIGDVFRQGRLGRLGRKAGDADGRSYGEFPLRASARFMRVMEPPHLNLNRLASQDVKHGSRRFAAGICGQIPAG